MNFLIAQCSSWETGCFPWASVPDPWHFGIRIRFRIIGFVLPSNGSGSGCHPYQNLRCPLECKKINFFIFLMFKKKHTDPTDPDPENCLGPKDQKVTQVLKFKPAKEISTVCYRVSTRPQLFFLLFFSLATHKHINFWPTHTRVNFAYVIAARVTFESSGSSSGSRLAAFTATSWPL